MYLIKNRCRYNVSANRYQRRYLTAPDYSRTNYSSLAVDRRTSLEMSEKKVLVNKRGRGASREELLQWSKEDLVKKVLQLEAYNFQLKQILQKKLGQSDTQLQQLTHNSDNQQQATAANEAAPKNKQQKRKFDFSKAHRRHVLLKLLYFGWDYQGLACQEDSNATIEHHLFEALIRTCLIESRASANYHRCGRTDKEVSAFCQVISIDLRSKYAPAEQLLPEALIGEIDYCALLNRVLPRNIQAITWMPLRSSAYSARFDCTARTYRYYFPRGNLNIVAMQQSCQLLQRHADFRNFCKMDVNNGVTNYVRNVQSASVQRCVGEQQIIGDEGYSMYFLEIKANAFLWHQIRCIMAILLLIGQGNEDPSVIDELLDVEKNACKPQYTPALGLPLNLFNCEFRKQTVQQGSVDGTVNAAASFPSDINKTDALHEDTTTWLYSEPNLLKLIETVQSEWAHFNIKCTMIRDVLHQLESLLSTCYASTKPVQAQSWLLQEGVRPRQYQKLLQRKRCESLENRIEHYVKKQRLIVKTDAQTNDDLAANVQ